MAVQNELADELQFAKVSGNYNGNVIIQSVVLKQDKYEENISRRCTVALVTDEVHTLIAAWEASNLVTMTAVDHMDLKVARSPVSQNILDPTRLLDDVSAPSPKSSIVHFGGPCRDGFWPYQSCRQYAILWNANVCVYQRTDS